MHGIFQLVLFFPVIVIGYVCKSTQMAFQFGALIAMKDGK